MCISNKTAVEEFGMKFNWKKSFLTAATLLSAVVLGACGDGEASTGDAGYVGIAMPTKSAE